MTHWITFDAFRIVFELKKCALLYVLSASLIGWTQQSSHFRCGQSNDFSEQKCDSLSNDGGIHCTTSLAAPIAAQWIQSTNKFTWNFFSIFQNQRMRLFDVSIWTELRRWGVITTEMVFTLRFIAMSTHAMWQWRVSISTQFGEQEPFYGAPLSNTRKESILESPRMGCKFQRSLWLAIVPAN